MRSKPSGDRGSSAGTRLDSNRAPPPLRSRTRGTFTVIAPMRVSTALLQAAMRGEAGASELARALIDRMDAI